MALLIHFLLSVTCAATRPSPPKKLKVAKPEKVQMEEEEEEWVEHQEPEELKRKVIPPKSVAVTPTVPIKAAKKTSVFDRLGESNVSSTTPEIAEPPTITAKTTTVKVTCCLHQSKTRSLLPNFLLQSQQSSVFRRLGGIQETKESPTPSVKVVKQVKPTPVTHTMKKPVVISKSEVPGN